MTLFWESIGGKNNPKVRELLLVLSHSSIRLIHPQPLKMRVDEDAELNLKERVVSFSLSSVAEVEEHGFEDALMFQVDLYMFEQVANVWIITKVVANPTLGKQIVLDLLK